MVKTGPPLGRTWRMPRPPRAGPGVSSWACRLNVSSCFVLGFASWAFCLVFFVPGPFFSSKKNVHWVIDLEWKGMKAYKIGSSCCGHKPKTTTTLVIFTLASCVGLNIIISFRDVESNSLIIISYLPHPSRFLFPILPVFYINTSSTIGPTL